MILLYVISMIALILLVRKGSIVKLETDLVCDMKVDPQTSLQYSYEGKTYYFCAPSCKRSFAKNPEAYINR